MAKWDLNKEADKEALPEPTYATRMDKVEKLFRYEHLPDHLQEVSKPFHDMAVDLVENLLPSAEVTLAIRKLWEAKNLAVYAAVEATD
ncbi:hypothetical protein [Roseovarius Plymouth podovirus 1]|uniref:Uncharacterized protein n=1 Tax=Roseovarius Plymouth podovirus 1 TaxID=926474 RepID=K4Q4U4_9CAUD|nr:hypothetical protein HYO70_gp29 [Roseovarius Plymouth podovirus 1]CBX87959.1 hypothetical protein [Roseovarius Plymouth podovirus 1]